MIKNGAKIKRKYHLDDFSVHSDKIFPYGFLVCLIVDFETLKPFSFQVSILKRISSSFLTSFRVYFDQGWGEKKNAIAFGRNSGAKSLWQALAFDMATFKN